MLFCFGQRDSKMKNSINSEVENINTILIQGKTSTVEFKSTFKKELVETVVAFANTKGGGYFY